MEKEGLICCLHPLFSAFEVTEYLGLGDDYRYEHKSIATLY